MADLTEQQFLAQDPEILGLQYKRQLANLLTGQAFNQPQGQMISGHYVKPSALQQALPMINAAIGGFTSANLDTEQQKIAKRLREEQVLEANNLLNIKKEQGIEAAYAAALRGQTPASQRMAAVFEKQLSREPNWKETEVNVNGVKVKGLYDANTGDVASTFRPYSSEINVPLRSAQYRGEIPASEGGGMPFGSFNGMFNQSSRIPQGMNQPIPTAPATIQPVPQQTEPTFIPKPTQNVVPSPVKPPVSKPDTSWEDNTPIPSLNAQPKPVVVQQAPAPILPINVKKYDLEPPKQFNTPKERDEWWANARQPLTGEIATKASGAVTTLQALDNYKNLIDKYSKEQILLPNARATLENAHAQLMLQLKDANGLGVLNKGDLPMLEKLIVNPNNMESLLLSKNVLENQITGQKAFMKDIVANAYLNNNKEIPPRIKQTLLNVDQQIQQAASQKEFQSSSQLEKPMMFNSQSAAQAAGKNGQIKDGQKIVINGQVYTWRKD